MKRAYLSTLRGLFVDSHPVWGTYPTKQEIRCAAQLAEIVRLLWSIYGHLAESNIFYHILKGG